MLASGPFFCYDIHNENKNSKPKHFEAEGFQRAIGKPFGGVWGSAPFLKETLRYRSVMWLWR